MYFEQSPTLSVPEIDMTGVVDVTDGVVKADQCCVLHFLSEASDSTYCVYGSDKGTDRQTHVMCCEGRLHDIVFVPGHMTQYI